MTKEQEALTLALEALNHLQPTALTSFYTIGDRDKAITAIKEALATPPLPVQPEQEPRWYCVDKIGMATLCADKDDAEQSAKLAEQDFPRNSPYRAVQLCEYTPQELTELHIWEARALQAEAVIEKFMATPPVPVQEPVARVIDNGTPEGATEWIPFTSRVEPLKTGDLLYTTPPLPVQPEHEPVAFDAFLNSKDFYELMQTYRHFQIDAFKQFEAVKDALRAAHNIGAK